MQILKKFCISKFKKTTKKHDFSSVKKKIKDLQNFF